jgi:chromosome transmission fidelity protein 1
LPYNLLLQKNARDTLGISLRGQVVVIDEAHSEPLGTLKLIVDLIDTLLSIHSISFPLQQIKTALLQLETYLARFRTRLKPVHALWVGQAVTLLRGLVRIATAWAEESSTRQKEEMLDVNELMRRVGGSGDQINLVALVAYLKESKLARKVSGYAERQAERARAKGEQSACQLIRIRADMVRFCIQTHEIDYCFGAHGNVDHRRLSSSRVLPSLPSGCLRRWQSSPVARVGRKQIYFGRHYEQSHGQIPSAQPC